jgi:hypothetical protein
MNVFKLNFHCHILVLNSVLSMTLLLRQSYMVCCVHRVITHMTTVSRTKMCQTLMATIITIIT